MKVALVYDRINKWGGAERVLLALQKIFPEAVLFTSVYNPNTASWAKKFSIKTSFLQNLPFAKSRHEYFSLLMPLAFEQFNFDEYDLVISVTSESAKGIITKPHTKHLCICLTPTRYLWSGYDEYFRNWLLNLVGTPFIWYLRLWDKVASKRPDAYIAISQEVKTRIEKYYSRDSKVVYPPLVLPRSDIKKLLVNNSLPKDIISGEYFLVVSRISRFTKYKRIDIAIKAATRLGLALVVVGGGDISYFKKTAGKSVFFVGKVSDVDLAEYYANCKALIFPGVEDFGLVMVEAQSFGKPVIAFRAGGALEIVRDGLTGVFFDSQTTESLVEVLKTFSKDDYNKHTCAKNAERFSFTQFETGISSIIKYL